ncbi:MAG: hypothetical protein KDC38_18300, partial [Planctomycetes bacterium]|nr:hypothetical protein [Planctomycetota bacterium]
VVTHDPELLPKMDRIVHLCDGRILETGSHADLVATSNRYRELFPGDGVETPSPTGILSEGVDPR